MRSHRSYLQMQWLSIFRGQFAPASKVGALASRLDSQERALPELDAAVKAELAKVEAAMASFRQLVNTSFAHDRNARGAGRNADTIGYLNRSRTSDCQLQAGGAELLRCEVRRPLCITGADARGAKAPRSPRRGPPALCGMVCPSSDESSCKLSQHQESRNCVLMTAERPSEDLHKEREGVLLPPDLATTMFSWSLSCPRRFTLVCSLCFVLCACIKTLVRL